MRERPTFCEIFNKLSNKKRETDDDGEEENFLLEEKNASTTENQNQIENNIAICSGKYGSISFIPRKEREEQEDLSGEEFIYIVDCSDSMSGYQIKLAAECLLIFIKSLPENGYFNVVRFGSEYIPLFERPILFTNEKADLPIY